ncbi:MAG: hypothetical protein J5722_07970 [Oscillospiraceae bacterium]|nr:hypothetical protein [Oscillospiraceae bacterium]
MSMMKDFFSPQKAEDSDAERFSFSEHLLGGMTLYVIKDRKTGVSYITKPGNDCPLTPLLGADGEPDV